MPRHAHMPPMSNLDRWLPGSVMPYNNFYLTTVTSAKNYNAVRSTVNSILATNSSVASSPYQPPVNVSGMNSFQLSASMSQAATEFMRNREGPADLTPDGDPSIKLNPNAVSPRRFVDYATNLARSSSSDLTYQFLPLRPTEAEIRSLEVLSSLLSANNAFGIYSESPFLRPVTLLRPVQFVFPTKVVFQYPDPENMVRTLRDLADQKVTSLPLLAILSGSKPNAAALGFCTNYLTYSFTLKLDVSTMRLLMDQPQPNRPTDKYRLILRMAWATTGLYMPGDKSNPSRVLASEVLPRCLSVRVARRNVTLPDPIFHGGQAQKFGRRLRFSIDITDKLPLRPNSSVRCRDIDIDLTWLHAPLEDHALPLLEMVGSGSCTPILNQLLNLPLVQVTLDRVQPIPEFVRMFSYAVAGTPVTDPPPGCNPPHLSSETPESLVGIYDFCRSPDRVIAASETLAMVKTKLTSEDDLQSDGWIPVSLLCPLALTRIEIPVRSVNCDHLQCFDLSSYLTMNKKRPRWSCPVCSLPAPFRDLRRDDFFVQLMADQSLKDAEMVHVDANGHWREASKVVQSDSSVVMSARASITAIPSDKPTIAAIPSLLNGASTLSPILESNFSSRPVTPMEPDVSPFNDCVILLDADDDDDEAGSSTQPQQTPGVRPTSSNSYSGQPLHAFVTDKQSEKRPPEAFDSALRKLFVGLAASSDNGFAATASAPLLSNLQSPAALALSSTPTTTDVSALVLPSCLHPGVTSPVPDASRLLTLAENAAPPPPRPPFLTATAAALVVSTSGTSFISHSPVPPNKLNKASDLKCELLTSLTSSVGVTSAFAASMQLPEVVCATMGYVIPPSKEAARTPEIRATYSSP